MIFYKDIVDLFSTKYDLDYLVSYPGIGFINKTTKQIEPQPSDRPFIQLSTFSGKTRNAVIINQGSKNIKRVPFTLVLEVLIPRSRAGTGSPVYTPNVASDIEKHFDTFLMLTKLKTSDDAYIYSAPDNPKTCNMSEARSDDRFLSVIYQYNFWYEYFG